MPTQRPSGPASRPVDLDVVDFGEAPAATPRPRPVSNGAKTPDPALERISPQAIEAEQSVLGSVLIDDQALDRIEGLLTPDDFYRKQHAEIFGAMLRLHAAGTPIDLVILGDELAQRDRLDAVGGPSYLTSLMNVVPTALHAEHYAQRVAHAALGRRAIAAAGRIAAIAYEEHRDTEVLLDRLRAVSEQLLGSWTGGEAVTGTISLADMQPPPNPDDWLVEGFVRPGTMCMIAGPPGAAKSWLARQLAITAGAGLRALLDYYPVRRPMRVLVIDEDNGPADEWLRDERLLGALGLTRGDVQPVRRKSLGGVELDQVRWQKWLRNEIETWQPDLLILDPISEMHGGKEMREEPGFRSLLRFLKTLKIDYPTMATVVVHHTRKRDRSMPAGESSVDEVRGQWGQTPDVIATLIPMAEQRSALELHKRVPHSKLILRQVARGEPGEGALVLVADESSGPERSRSADDKVLAAIEAGAEEWDQIQHATGLSKAGVFKILSRLKKARLVTKTAPYQLLEGE